MIENSTLVNIWLIPELESKISVFSNLHHVSPKGHIDAK